MAIYTKTGDRGETSLYDGTRVRKDSLRVEAYGTVDELNSHIGSARNFIEDEDIRERLFKIQKKLFFVAGELATPKLGSFKYPVSEDDIIGLEKWIDEFLAKTDMVEAFIIPGTSLAASMLHVSRTICRRAERRILALDSEDEVRPVLIKFVNRLSDTLYSIARYLESDIVLMDFEAMSKEKL